MSATFEVNEIDFSKPVKIDDLRRNLGEAVSHVKHTHESVLILRHGKPVAALVPLSELNKINTLKGTSSTAEPASEDGVAAEDEPHVSTAAT